MLTEADKIIVDEIILGGVELAEVRGNLTSAKGLGDSARVSDSRKPTRPDPRLAYLMWLPVQLPPGKVLLRNSVRPTRQLGMRAFRAWLEDPDPDTKRLVLAAGCRSWAYITCPLRRPDLAKSAASGCRRGGELTFDDGEHLLRRDPSWVWLVLADDHVAGDDVDLVGDPAQLDRGADQRLARR